MERQNILHEQRVIATRKVAQVAPFKLAIQSLDGAVECHEVNADRARSLGTLPCAPQAFCLFQDRLVIVDSAGRCWFRALDQAGAEAAMSSFAGVTALSANKESLLLLTSSNELLCIDQRLQVQRALQIPHRVVDMSLGEDNTLWIAGGEEVLGGYPVFWSTDHESFRQIPWPASAVSLYGDRSGIVWTINSNQDIWKLHRLGEGNMPGCRQDAACRNCMFKGYRGALQVASPEGLFLVLHPDHVLRGYPFAGAAEPMMEWRNVRRFSVG